MRRRIAAAILLTACCCAPLPTFAQCERWLPGPFDNGTASSVVGKLYCSTSWDPDGDGPLFPRLVVAGSFTSIGGVATHNVAWRDPATGTWNAFGPGITFTVRALAVLNGQVVAAGDGDTNPAADDDNVLRWNGVSWASLGGGTATGNVNALAVWNGELYAGGYFVANPSWADPVSNIGRWDEATATWQSVGGGTDGTVSALHAWQGVLYAGGSFHHAGGVAANYIARFDGTWHALSSEPKYYVNDLEGGYNGELLAATSFTGANGATTPAVGGWNGFSWNVRAVQAVPSGIFLTCGIYNGSIYAGGSFESLDGMLAGGVARWDGTRWVSVGQGAVNHAAVIYDLAPYNGELLAVGDVQQLDFIPVGGIGRWNGTEWGAFGGYSALSVAAMTPYNGRLVAGGYFHAYAGTGPSVSNIGAWRGTTGLSAFGTGTDADVTALCAYTSGTLVNPSYELVAGGYFTVAGGLACNHVARWIEKTTIITPPAWAPMGQGFNAAVSALERYNSALYAGGSFTASGATPLGHIARWNTAASSWESVGNFDGSVEALKVWNGQLYAGGSFTSVNGVPTGGLARWNGSTWSACGGVFSTGYVHALEVYNGQLVIGGEFTGVPGSPNLATWDGTSISTLGSGGTNRAVHALRAAGTRLYVGGEFLLAGGLSCQHLAWWDGTWHAMSGATNTVESMCLYNGELHVGGSFQYVDDGLLRAPTWARYTETGVPWFATQPSSRNVAPGTNVTFTASPPPGYSGYSTQWYRNGVPLADGFTGHGSIVSGAHTSTLEIDFTNGQTDWGKYHAEMSNSCGSVQSVDATLSFDGYADVAPGGTLQTAFAAMGPNPSRGATTLQYSLARDADVRVRVHDIAGRLVWSRELGHVAAGRHAAEWDARDAGGDRVRAGLYLVTLEVDGARLAARRLVVTR